MRVSKRFIVVATTLLILTISVKALTNSSVSDPKFADIAAVLTPYLYQEGFEVTGPVAIGPREALLAVRAQCLAYFLPVAHQGWDQEMLRRQLQPDQQLWFAFQGKLTMNSQPTFWPTVQYFRTKWLRYLSNESRLPPMLAIITMGNCDLKAIDLANVPTIPFLVSSFRVNDKE